MEIRHLVTFQKVATLLSFRRAAEELSYAQSSVTTQVRSLESSLGTELFDRLGGRIRLTPAGEKLPPGNGWGHMTCGKVDLRMSGRAARASGGGRW